LHNHKKLATRHRTHKEKDFKTNTIDKIDLLHERPPGKRMPHKTSLSLMPKQIKLMLELQPGSNQNSGEFLRQIFAEGAPLPILLYFSNN